MATLIDHGLVGPKGMTKVGPDGQLVNIPALVYVRWSDGGNKCSRIIGFHVCGSSEDARQIRHHNRVGCMKGRIRSTQRTRRAFQEKLLRLCIGEPYRKPTQVIRSSRPRRTSEMSSRNSAKKQP